MAALAGAELTLTPPPVTRISRCRARGSGGTPVALVTVLWGRVRSGGPSRDLPRCRGTSPGNLPDLHKASWSAFAHSCEIRVSKTIWKSEGLLQHAGRPGVLTGNEGYDRAWIAGTPGSPGAVNVILRVSRRIEVDYAGDVVHVDTARGDVCCNQRAGLAGSELRQCSVAL